MKLATWKSMLISGAAAFCCVPAAQAGWVTVSNSGTPVLSTCNPKPYTFPTPSTCLLAGNSLLAALGTGIILKVSASSPIVVAGVTVGTLYDRVYCYGIGTTCSTVGVNANTYILAARVHLNTNPWNGHNLDAFEVDDIIRRIRNGVSADSAYWVGPDTGGSTTTANPDLALSSYSWLQYTGKTQYGVWDPLVGTRDNNYIDHRYWTNAGDPDGISSEWSGWVLAKQVCVSGLQSGQANFTIKLWAGGEEPEDHYTQWMPGYRCA